jgi:integrase/recombinase XerD
MLEERKKCAELIDKVLSVMLIDNYSHKSVDHNIRYVYCALVKFCDDHFEGKYFVEAGETFMKMIYERKMSKEHTSFYKNSVERLNHAFAGDFHWRPANHKKKPYASSCFDEIIVGYENYTVQTGKTETNVRHHIHLVARFLEYIESNGITNIASITADVVYNYFIATGDKDGFRKIIKAFFRYVYKYDFISHDISCWVPTVSRHKPVPTVYTVDEINKILNTIDRNTDIGKRNYCIILMSARLGMRACDIVGLSLDNINHTGGVIQLLQKKTGVPIEFPLLQEISVALDDYIDNARPDSNLRNVFLTVPRPDTSDLSTQGVYAIVSGAIVKSGVNTHSRRLGSHALRSSLASQLLDEGRTYPEIQQVLGHSSPEVAKHYIRVKVDHLRECALEVPAFPHEMAATFLERQVLCP